MNYLSKIPFIIELEVSKIWSESLFEWDALSNVGAGGLQQLMEPTARDFGLTVAKSPEIKKLNAAISGYKKLRSGTVSKRQELHALVETGSGELSPATVSKINKLRVELSKMGAKRSAAYRKLKAEKIGYVRKIRSMDEKQRSKFDARFVPKLLIPMGIKHIVRDITECRDFFGGSVEMNAWRGVAAYNAGLDRTKKWGGLPFIEETVHFTRTVISNLTKSLELKHAYSTGDEALIAEAKSRIRLKSAYRVYTVKPGDCFSEIVREQIMDRYKLPYNKAVNYIKDGKGNKIIQEKVSTIFPNQKFRIYSPNP